MYKSISDIICTSLFLEDLSEMALIVGENDREHSSKSVSGNGGDQYANAKVYNSCDKRSVEMVDKMVDKRSVEMVLNLPGRGGRGGSLGTTETKALMSDVLSLEGNASINDVLPLEMLYQVFINLASWDLKMVLLVCKKWKDAASSPSLWSSISFFTSARLVPSEFPSLLRMMSLGRFRFAKEMRINPFPQESSEEFWYQLLQGILQHQGLRRLTIKANIAKADPHLLAEVFTKMAEVQIGLMGTNMTDKQRKAFSDKLQGPHLLNKLTMGVPPPEFFVPTKPTNLGLFIKALNKIPQLSLCIDDGLTNLLLQNMRLDKETTVESLSLTRILDFSELGRTSFYASFDKLEELHLAESFPRSPQHLVNLFCQSLASKGTKIKRLSLNFFDLSEVDSQVLGRMVAQLEELSLLSMTQTELGRGQVELILNSAKKLKKFETLRVASMAEVDPEIMAEKVNQLEEFTILSEDFNSRSLERVLSQAVKKTSLEKLHWEEDIKTKGEIVILDLISEAKKVISCVRICI